MGKTILYSGIFVSPSHNPLLSRFKNVPEVRVERSNRPLLSSAVVDFFHLRAEKSARALPASKFLRFFN